MTKLTRFNRTLQNRVLASAIALTTIGGTYLGCIPAEAQQTNPCIKTAAETTTNDTALIDLTEMGEPENLTTTNDTLAKNNPDPLALYNGYCIFNNTDETFILEYKNKHDSDFGVKPPPVLHPRQKYYFEVTWWFGFTDNSILYYKDTKQTDAGHITSLEIRAKQHREPFGLIKDFSSCDSSNQFHFGPCTTKKINRTQQQTTFEFSYRKPKQ